VHQGELVAHHICPLRFTEPVTDQIVNCVLTVGSLNPTSAARYISNHAVIVTIRMIPFAFNVLFDFT